MAQQFTLPDWARLYGQQVDLRSSPYWAAQDSGSGSATLGGGDGSGFYGLLERFAGQRVGTGDGEYTTPADIQGATDYLGSSGQQLMQAYGGNNEVARWLQDAQGNITGAPELSSLDDDNFGYAALLAGGLVGGSAAGLFGGAGGAAAGATGSGIGTLGTIAPGSSALAPIASTGLASTAPAITASIPQVGGLLAAGGGISSLGTIASGSEALAPLATTGQASTAPLVSASIPQAGAAGGMFGTSQLGQMANGLLDYAKANPQVVGGLLGGLTGATGGMTSGGGGEAPYTGPMPTISRGNWQPRAQAQMMALPQFQAPEVKQGVQGSGLWRFLGGK